MSNSLSARERFIRAIDQLLPHMTDPFVPGAEPTVPFDPARRAKLTGEIIGLGPRLGIAVEYDRLTTDWGPLTPGEAQTRLSHCRSYLRALRAAAEAQGATVDASEYVKLAVSESEKAKAERAASLFPDVNKLRVAFDRLMYS